MYSDRRGTDRNHPGQNLPDKIQKSQVKNPCEQLRENLYRGLLSGIFVLGLLKIGGGSEMCDVLLGVPRCVTKCDRGSKLAKNSVTYFMDGPLCSSLGLLVCGVTTWGPLHITSLCLGGRNPWAWTSQAKTIGRRKMGCIGQAYNVDFVGQRLRWAWSMQIGLVKPIVDGFVIMTETRMRKMYL